MTFLSPNTDKALRESSHSQKEHEALRIKLLGIIWVLSVQTHLVLSES